jgi:AraC-like DNA-binding protein
MRIHEFQDGTSCAELIHAAAGTTLVGHTHDVPHALVVFDGVMSDDGRPYAPGDVRLSPGGDPHVVRFRTASTCLVILSPHGGALPAVAERRSARLPTGPDPRLFALLAGDPPAAPTAGELAGLVGDTLGALVAAAGLEIAPPAWLRELRHCIIDRDDAGHDVARLARRAGVSREHLSRSFQRHYGTSFVTFRRHQRVAAACRLMRTTWWPLAEVACAAGFADQSHMTRAFGACLGTTPAAFRARQPLHGRSQPFNPGPDRSDSLGA